MSEEINNATVIVPRAMIFSISLNGLLGLGMLIATLFCLGDVDKVLAAPYPFMAIFEQAVGNAGGATAMSAIITVLMICALISFVATGSRMTWSFARDRGLPGWRYLSMVRKFLRSSPFQVPETLTNQRLIKKPRYLSFQLHSPQAYLAYWL